MTTSIRELEIVPMTRQQLVVLVRVHIAEGMKVEQARIHAEMHSLSQGMNIADVVRH